MNTFINWQLPSLLRYFEHRLLFSIMFNFFQELNWSNFSDIFLFSNVFHQSSINLVVQSELLFYSLLRRGSDFSRWQAPCGLLMLRIGGLQAGNGSIPFQRLHAICGSCTVEALSLPVFSSVFLFSFWWAHRLVWKSNISPILHFWSTMQGFRKQWMRAVHSPRCAQSTCQSTHWSPPCFFPLV